MGQETGSFYRMKNREQGRAGIELADWLGLRMWLYLRYHRNRAITHITWHSWTGYLDGLTSRQMEHLQEHEN